MNENLSNLSPETQEFVKIFNFSTKDEITPWINNDTVGFSIIKEYPRKGLFVPAINQEGKPDSVALIRIGYDKSEEKKLPLRVTIHKVSRYLINGHWNFNYDDKESPTEESAKESKSSRRPIDLEELSRYIYHSETKKIFDLEKNKYI